MAEKNSLEVIGVSKRTLELREQFLRQRFNPYRHMTGEGGHLFDPAYYRFQAMRATQWNYFKPTYKSGWVGFCSFIVPFSIMFYLVKNERDEKEHQFRTGQVAYKDRLFKFV